ncbi:MAG: HNH endonuclease [Candidatus Omnitrophica bacterium]|nr:HNH endonuclease [Candidatus Omnitrophota bacterium]
MNNWNIPDKLEQEIRERDKVCVYCGVKFGSLKNSRKTQASWEHIINDASIITYENIALCCVGCNASKGQKKLSDWINSKYCQNKGITYDTVAGIIKKALNKNL